MSMDTTIDDQLSDVEAFARKLRGELPAAFPPGDPAWVASCPGALDCMGGFAEYCGSLTLTLPTTDSVRAAVQPRQDQTVQVVLLGSGHNGDPTSCSLPLSLWYQDGVLAEAPVFAHRVEELNAKWSLAVVGVLHALLAGGCVPHFGGGLTLAVTGPPSWGADPAAGAAAAAATAAAACAALGAEVPPEELALLAQRGVNFVAGVPGGLSAAVCALLGEPRTPLQLRCQPLELVGTLALPNGVAFLGIDCGARHPAAVSKYREAWAAALMGRRIIRAILETQGRSGDWDGYLARLSVSDYVGTLRDRLPTKLKGADFIERYGMGGVPATLIDQSVVYKIRSRTEHHIYENARVHQFVERIARARRSGEQGPLAEAGELMFASHWSYGQRCGLGSIETDKLVNCLRQRGVAAGILGARVCGAGAGGGVAVLLSDIAPAHAAVREALAEYTQATGRRTRLLSPAAEGRNPHKVHRVA